jgi:hypothetical protein
MQESIDEVQAATGGIAGKIEPKANPGDIPTERPGRNDKCHCGSDRKYKKCCLEKDADIEREDTERYQTELLIAMCEGRRPFDQPSAIKVLSAHTDGWMCSHNDDIKYLRSLIRALKTLPASGSDSFITLHDTIITRDDLIAEYEASLAEMTGPKARADYMTEYALAELMNKSYFMDQMDSRPEGDIPDRLGYDPDCRGNGDIEDSESEAECDK